VNRHASTHPTFGEALEGMLEALGLSQAEFARRTDLSSKHVNQLIRGHAHLTPEVAITIADTVCEHLLGLAMQGRLRELRGEEVRPVPSSPNRSGP
jgi:plasmid maintenance system antidote protein VapI